MTGRHGSLGERFLRHVSIPDLLEQCWSWTGFKSRGYGRIQVTTGKGEYAHRVAYQLFIIPILKRRGMPHSLEGKDVLHNCDNPGCVNPLHLFLGDQRSNNRDRNRKGRQARGERSGSAKLTRKQVREIRERYARGRVSHRKLAKEYGVSHREIGQILQGKWWREAFKQ
jgi:hypothetical protein